MTPLSWHTYSGNTDIVELLLDNGANINDEFDLSKTEKATVLDISTLLTKDNKPDDEPDAFAKTHALLLSRGAKKFHELP